MYWEWAGAPLNIWCYFMGSVINRFHCVWRCGGALGRRQPSMSFRNCLKASLLVPRKVRECDTSVPAGHGTLGHWADARYQVVPISKDAQPPSLCFSPRPPVQSTRHLFSQFWKPQIEGRQGHCLSKLFWRVWPLLSSWRLCPQQSRGPLW